MKIVTFEENITVTFSTSFSFNNLQIHLFSDVYDVSDFQLQLIVVNWLVVEQHLALSLLRLCVATD